MSRDKEAFDRLYNGNPWRRTVEIARDHKVIIACLIRAADWRPLSALWWRKKSVSIIAVDLSGNFFLHHSDGGVRYWDHRTQTEMKVAGGILEFCSKIEETPELIVGFRPDLH